MRERESAVGFRTSQLPLAICGVMVFSSVVATNALAAGIVPDGVVCGQPNGWYFTPQGWTTVTYGRGPVFFVENVGSTTANLQLNDSSSSTFDYGASVSASAQVDALFASVSSSLSINMSRSIMDEQSVQVSVPTLGRHYGLIQNAEAFENVTGTLFYNTDTLNGCATSQSQIASISAPFVGSKGYAVTGTATSPTPSWPQK